MFGKLFTRIANSVSIAAGKPVTFILCVVIVVVWAVSGPIFGFTDTWQLIINTGTTIVTFLMVFLIQNTQNRDGVAIQAKLDELVRVSEAKNAFIGIEHLTEEEVEAFRRRCEAAARKADKKLDDIAAQKAKGKKPSTASSRRRPSATAAGTKAQA
ncbi:MAG: low affinity iron permease family protein [Phyllobacterium sp.]